MDESVHEEANGMPIIEENAPQDFEDVGLDTLGFDLNKTVNWNKFRLSPKVHPRQKLVERIMKRQNTDCLICIDDKVFDCHLIVLQGYSEMIDEMATFKRFQLNSTKCSPETFECIYEWMINADATPEILTRQNVLNIYIASQYLRIKHLECQCYALMDNPNVFNEELAFILYMKAKEKHVDHIRALMLPRIQSSFLLLVSSEDWLDLDLESVKEFLTSNYINVNCEMEVFASAVRWLVHDWQGRGSQKLELFRCVRFGNIDSWQLVDIKTNPANTHYITLAQDPAICKLIDDGLAYATMKPFYKEKTALTSSIAVDLQAPAPRNWTGVNKVHYTYEEFLLYIEKHKRQYLSYRYSSQQPQRKRPHLQSSAGLSKPRP